MFCVVCDVWLINVEHNPSIIICCEDPFGTIFIAGLNSQKLMSPVKFIIYFTSHFSGTLGRRWPKGRSVTQSKWRIWLTKLQIANCISLISAEFGYSRVFWGVRYRVWVNPGSAWSRVMTVVSSARLMLSLSHPQFRHYQADTITRTTLQ